MSKGRCSRKDAFGSVIKTKVNTSTCPLSRLAAADFIRSSSITTIALLTSARPVFHTIPLTIAHPDLTEIHFSDDPVFALVL